MRFYDSAFCKFSYWLYWSFWIDLLSWKYMFVRAPAALLRKSYLKFHKKLYGFKVSQEKPLGFNPVQVSVSPNSSHNPNF